MHPGADLARDRCEPKRPHRRANRIALFFELPRARADEDTQPPVGGIDAVLPDAHVRVSLAAEDTSGSHCTTLDTKFGTGRLGRAWLAVSGECRRRQQEEEMALDDRFCDVGDLAAVALRV